ncbi:Autophagy-related protein 14 [Erysiphe necator]|uniref:Autophagy-related protein 14 n=1 Tax=Uncinula necator TaxID=52586 RepID=A0A0B1P1N9_UNCNE|nr:Autophagy-related protein 14 [Erysiphe necator]KHJ32562.1 hypothetical protein EV44_g5399 [Erysiphe necator]
MQCDICLRMGGQKLPLLCPTDARNFLYGPRIEHATVLIEKDALDQQVTSALSKREIKTQIMSAVTPLDLIAIKAETDQILDRTKLILAKAEELRDKVEQARLDLLRRKAVISRRKSDLVSASCGIDARRNRTAKDVERSIQTIKAKWHQKHVSIMSARSFLCSEAARLYGLKKVKSKNLKDEYKIGRSLVVDLDKLHTVSAAQVSTVLSHIAHLLILTVHYLGLQLPAEITLPHRDYPLPTIFPLQTSYKFSDVLFPGHTLPQTTHTTSQSVKKAQVCRPRPLYILKPLPTIAIEDSMEYTLFLEGVALLAYNVTWVCKSQGIAIGEEENFQDICKIGRNLFNLLIGTPQRLSLEARHVTRQNSSNRDVIGVYNSDLDDRASLDQKLGRYSHNTAYSFLGRSEGNYIISSWRLLSPVEITDRLQSHLMSEAANAEWEMLNADSWEGNQECDNYKGEVVIWQNKRVSKVKDLGIRDFLNKKKPIDASDVLHAEGEQKFGTSGWTKLKPR